MNGVTTVKRNMRKTAIQALAGQQHEDEEIRDSEEKYRAIFKTAMFAICLIDPKSLKIADCNQKAAELSGYTMKTLRGMKVTDLYPEDEQDIVSKIFEKASGLGSLSGVCGVNQSRYDGSRFPVELDLATMRTGTRDYILCFARDISGQKEEEERLRFENKRLSNILGSMEDGIYAVTPQYEIEYLSPSFRRELGDVKGRKCYEYFGNRKDACPSCDISKVFSGQTVRREWFLPKNRKTYDTISAPMKNPDGSTSRLAVLRDITGRRKIEETFHEKPPAAAPPAEAANADPPDPLRCPPAGRRQGRGSVRACHS
ncbi:MAG: PAS domain S-box protein [Nitrospiraceae bacterium]|nr:MAG: PAS domain S-box protein [Nitrospiraceae bacterium]